METQTTHRCQVCEQSVPNRAEFCPFCGGTQRRMTTPLAALDAVLARQTEMMQPVKPAELVEQTIFFGEPRVEPLDTKSVHYQMLSEDDWDDEILYDAGRGKRIAAGLVIFFSVTSVALASLFLFVQIHAPIDVAGASVLNARETVQKPDEPQKFSEEKPIAKEPIEAVRATVAQSGKVASVKIGEHAVFELTAKKGSRYNSLKERAKSVELRLNHVLKEVRANKPDGAVFVARTNGDRSEVSWQNPNGSYFRVLDVTKNDVHSWSHKHKSKTSAHILSNLLADELNAVMEKSFPKQS